MLPSDRPSLLRFVAAYRSFVVDLVCNFIDLSMQLIKLPATAQARHGGIIHMLHPNWTAAASLTSTRGI